MPGQYIDQSLVPNRRFSIGDRVTGCRTYAEGSGTVVGWEGKLTTTGSLEVWYMLVRLDDGTIGGGPNHEWRVTLTDHYVRLLQAHDPSMPFVRRRYGPYKPKVRNLP